MQLDVGPTDVLQTRCGSNQRPANTTRVTKKVARRPIHSLRRLGGLLPPR
jgi:hypothetical protein